jgi:hypothetical protein
VGRSKAQQGALCGRPPGSTIRCRRFELLHERRALGLGSDEVAEPLGGGAELRLAQEPYAGGADVLGGRVAPFPHPKGDASLLRDARWVSGGGSGLALDGHASERCAANADS